MAASHRTSLRRVLLVSMLLGTNWIPRLSAEEPENEMLELPVRVVDSDGQPVEGATVIPWALRSSQGHGAWTDKRKGLGEPPTLTTDAEGRIDVAYPRYTYAEEQVRTTEVTLSIDHPDFAYVGYEFINVPHEENEPHEAKLQRGAPVEIVPMQDGAPAALEGLHAIWSDGRSWKPGVTPSRTAEGALRIPSMPEGAGQVLLVRLDGGRATHFSEVVDFDLKAGETLRREVELSPSVRIEGKLSDNVPRPVKNGRLKARTLPGESSRNEVEWMTWAPIEEDGTFVIDGWPSSESLQLIALCDGFIAESGWVADLARFLPDTRGILKSKANTGWGLWRPDPFERPQLFSPLDQRDPLVLRMTPRAICVVEAVDQQGAPLAGVEVVACPNVGWWNGGSQIYGTPLARGERLLVERDYTAAIDDVFAEPFHAVTDASGRAELELPPGSEDVYARHDDYELPVIRGRREQQVQLVVDKPTTVRLVLQPKGNEYLGEWDKLSGVLFGCTGDECRRLLADEGFRKRIEVVGAKLDAAENPTDPAVLSDAYLKMAAAFDEVEDGEEAEKWRRKAAEQEAKLEGRRENAATEK